MDECLVRAAASGDMTTGEVNRGLGAMGVAEKGADEGAEL